MKFGFRTGQEPANILVVPQDHQQTSGAEESAIFTALETYSSTSSYSAAEAQLSGGFHGMHAVAGFDALDQMVPAGVLEA